jgi:hypothetical protein
MTKGHVALGGGGLALFGSGCLHTWPESLEHVLECFTSQEVVDWKTLMDDSAYRLAILIYRLPNWAKFFVDFDDAVSLF